MFGSNNRFLRRQNEGQINFSIFGQGITEMRLKIESLEKQAKEKQMIIKQRASTISDLRKEGQLLKRRTLELEQKLQEKDALFNRKINQISASISSQWGVRITQKQFTEKEKWLIFDKKSATLMKQIYSSEEKFPQLFKNCRQTMSQYETNLINFMNMQLESFVMTVTDQIEKEQQEKKRQLASLQKCRDSFQTFLEEEKRNQHGEPFVLSQEDMTNVLNLVILKIDHQKKLLNDLESLKSSIKRTVLSELKESNERMNEREEEEQ